MSVVDSVTGSCQINKHNTCWFIFLKAILNVLSQIKYSSVNCHVDSVSSTSSCYHFVACLVGWFPVQKQLMSNLVCCDIGVQCGFLGDIVDILDGWPGPLTVVSHINTLMRSCQDFFGLLRLLPWASPLHSWCSLRRDLPHIALSMSRIMRHYQWDARYVVIPCIHVDALPGGFLDFLDNWS